MYMTTYDSPVGVLTLLCNDRALTGLYFPGQWTGEAVGQDDHPIFRLACRWLDAYFAGERPDPTQIPLTLEGSAFRKRVWALLRTIPYGETVSYGALARQLGDGRMSAQAVGGAVGHNPISIVVPCHRVIGADGSLTGFAGGLWRKKYLLDLEQRNP